MIDESPLIDSIYHAGVDAGHWQTVIDLLAEKIPGSKTMLVSQDLCAQTGTAFVHAGFDAARVREYEQYYSAINPWVPVVSACPVFEVLVSDSIHPSRLFRDSEFYTDFLLREGDIESASGVKIFDENEGFVSIYAHYSEKRAEKNDIESRLLLNKISPHLKNSVQIARRYGESAARSLRSLVDSVGVPTFVIDTFGKTCLANDAAAALLSAGVLAQSTQDGKFVITDANANRKLDQLCLDWKHDRHSFERRAAIPLGKGAGEWIFTPYFGVPHPHAAWMIDAMPLVIVSYQQATLSPGFDVDALRADFSLTPAEARIAEQIALGRSLNDASREYGIKIGTVRNQLKSIFHKVGVHRQNELVAFMSRNYTTKNERAYY